MQEAARERIEWDQKLNEGRMARDHVRAKKE